MTTIWNHYMRILMDKLKGAETKEEALAISFLMLEQILNFKKAFDSLQKNFER